MAMAKIDEGRRRLSVGVSQSGGVSSVDLKKHPVNDAVLPALQAFVSMSKVPEGTLIALLTSKTDMEGKRRASFQEKTEDSLPLHKVTKDGQIEEIKGDAAQFAREKGLAWACKKGMKPESPNQDSFSILMVDGVFSLYGVYDGHGPAGHDVSDIANKLVVAKFLEARNQGSSVNESFKKGFEECNQYFVDMHNEKDKLFDPSMSGTTCTMAYHDLVNSTITIAYAGDSRAMIATIGDTNKVCFSTEDHKPNLPKEKQAIEAAGGRVIFDGYFNHRVFTKKGMYPGLNMSRALGDIVGYLEAGIRPTPDAIEINLKTGDMTLTDALGDVEKKKLTLQGELVLCLCTDGVWEFLECEDALKIVLDKKGIQQGMDRLVKESWDKWMADSGDDLSDDITGIAIKV